jgi:hypothetical protein
VSLDRWEKLLQIFIAALQREPGERLVFARQACRGDASLQAEVESLLRSYDEESGTLKVRSWVRVPRTGSCGIWIPPPTQTMARLSLFPTPGTGTSPGWLVPPRQPVSPVPRPGIPSPSAAIGFCA